MDLLGLVIVAISLALGWKLLGVSRRTMRVVRDEARFDPEDLAELDASFRGVLAELYPRPGGQRSESL